MSEFKQFQQAIHEQFTNLTNTGKLFRIKLTGSQIWDKYISLFKPEDNPKFRDPNSSAHECNNCKNFIRRYGNIVALNDNGELISIFSNISTIKPYNRIARKLAEYITTSTIENVFFESFESLNNTNYEACKKNQEVFQLGIKSNTKRYTKSEADLYGTVKANELRKFYHFHLELPKKFVDTTGKSIEQITAFYRDKYNVFKRAIEEIPVDTLRLVKDLINQNSLLDGTAHLEMVELMCHFKEDYAKTDFNKDIWCWTTSYTINERVAKFKNTLIGVLCTELAEGLELNKACTNWNKRVDPVNYHKATAPITQKQIAEAQKFVEENGYANSFNRRLAVLDDIKADEIKHINIGNGELKGVSIFDSVKATSTRHKKAEYAGVQEVSIDTFMSDILQNCTKVEALLENKHEGNMVVMTTGAGESPKSIFKWNNPYSWTFNGNLAGKSQIKEAVKTAGGAVDGILRFSMLWADGNSDNSDLDAHCIEPDRHLISYSNKHSRNTGGVLDIDITQPNGKLAVENITYPSLNKMIDGEYKFIVHQYAERNSKGFKAEIEFNGEIYSYEYPKIVKQGDKIPVATVVLKNGEFVIRHHLQETNSSREIWELNTKEFHKVNLICNSPNHWNENNAGNLHYMFILDNCKANTSIRGFHNENLLPELLKHRKVMEVLGATNMIEPTSNHLAGLGFNSTVRDELIVKCSGNFNRMLKIKF